MDPDEGQALDLLYAVLDVGQLLDQRPHDGPDCLVVEQGHQLVGAGLGHWPASLPACSISSMSGPAQSDHRESATIVLP